ncbi:MAG: hypothetical protein M1832_000359 [Thelocarpon impressellum]|nr:MAG: hypothetical protein M1832_000359 [Thelocarpon impressellum]
MASFAADCPASRPMSRSSSSSTLSCIAVEAIATAPPATAPQIPIVSAPAIRPKKRRANATAGGRRSTRLDVVDKAKAGVRGGLSTLGKRGRDAVDAGRDKVRDMARGLHRKTSKRSAAATERGTQVPQEGPASKKARTADVFEEEGEDSPAAARPAPPRAKGWLSHGLYVGQTRPAQTRRPKAKKAGAPTPPQQPERTMLPLPMFGGQRLLDTGRDFKLPFDVFSPLPPKQPKPEEYRKLSKNVFIGDAAGLWKKIKPQEASRCLCTSGTGCEEHCQNRAMFYECDENNCNVGPAHCTNRAFEDLRRRGKAGGKFNSGVEVVRTEGKGFGVRSNRSFEPHQIIVEYTGEIITQEECEERMQSAYKHSECFYLMMFDQNMIIDAMRGSIARFVNHSCEPNCRMVKWTVAGKPRMALFAGEAGVMTGEELTYDYNFDPFSAKNAQPCRCGSAQCRGILGPRQKEGKAGVLRAITGQAAKGAKRKLAAAMGGGDEVRGALKGSKKRKLAVVAPRMRAGRS